MSNATNKGEVLLVGPLPPPYGGISVHLARLSAALIKRGYRVTILATGRSAPPSRPNCHLVKNSLLRHAYRLLSERPPGLVHVHHSISVLAWWTVMLASQRQLPVVTTLHGALQSFIPRRIGADSLWRRALERSSALIAVNSHIAEMLRSLTRRPIDVVPAFLPPTDAEVEDLGSLARAWLDAHGERPVISIAAYRALSPLNGGSDVYGLNLLVQAAEILSRRGVQFSLAVSLACAPANARESDFFSETARQLRKILDDRVGIFIGERATPVIARSAVFVRPTLMDGDSVAVREALFWGVPVVASDAVPRPPQVMCHRTGDARSLAASIVEALSAERPTRLTVDNTERILHHYQHVMRQARVR